MTAVDKKRTFRTSNDLDKEVRDHMIALCNQNLADTLDLYTQTKQAHWNVKGIHFYQLHELFDDLAETVQANIDIIAERATALGGYATGTARMGASATRLPEYPTDVIDGRDHVQALVERYALYGANVRQAIADAEDAEDADTVDMFTDISRETDKQLWFLEAHLQGKE